MNWQFLFLSANGRIGQKDFWIGVLILFVAGIVLGWIPLVGDLLRLALLYAGVCLYSKRLHDFGKTGWLAAVPYGLLALAILISIFMGTAAVLGAASGTAVGTTGALAAAGMIGLLWMLVGLVCLGFLLWVGLTRGDPAPNQYGAPTPSMFDGGTTTTTTPTV